MKTILLWIGRILLLAFVFCAGWLVNWWNSPLASHLCLNNGRELTMAVVREMGYWAGWALIGGVCLIVIAIPLYGIWYQLHTIK